jgi:hypothetical protein
VHRPARALSEGRDGQDSEIGVPGLEIENPDREVVEDDETEGHAEERERSKIEREDPSK